MPQAEKMCDNCRSAAMKAMRKYGKRGKPTFMARYELCPRCQLNFIDADSEEFCEVCRMEMNGEKTFTDNLDEVETEETELCPICGENYMRAGEKMCDECKKKSEYEEDVEEEEEDPDKDDAWRSYLDDDDTGEDLGISVGEDELDDDEEEEEEEEESSDSDDDFEYVSADDYIDDDDDEDDDDDSFDDEVAPTPKSGSAKRRRRDDDDF